jgi:hypothetical protein
MFDHPNNPEHSIMAPRPTMAARFDGNRASAARHIFGPMTPRQNLISDGIRQDKAAIRDSNNIHVIEFGDFGTRVNVYSSARQAELPWDVKQ